VRWNGNERPTTFLSDSKLSVDHFRFGPCDPPISWRSTWSLHDRPSQTSNLIFFPVMPRNALAIERISLGSDGAQLNTPSFFCLSSVELVAWVAWVQADDASGFKVMLRDTCLHADPSCLPSNQVVSIAPSGGEFKFNFRFKPAAPALSADGRLVAFSPGDYSMPIDLSEVAVRDTCIDGHWRMFAFHAFFLHGTRAAVAICPIERLAVA